MVDEYEVCKYVCFEYKVILVEWLEDKGKWFIYVLLKDGDFVDEVNFLFIVIGYFVDLKLFEYFGMDRFKGDIFYIFVWKILFDLIDKKIVVIGNGVLGI